jgi:uncharacterized membrane protein
MKKYFVTGLLIWIPLVITFVVLAWIINTLDQILLLVPPQSGRKPSSASMSRGLASSCRCCSS